MSDRVVVADVEREWATPDRMGCRHSTVMLRGEIDRDRVRGSSPGVEWRGWTCLSGVVTGGQVRCGRVERADTWFTARVTGVTFPRTLDVGPFQCQVPPFQCEVLMLTW